MQAEYTFRGQVYLSFPSVARIDCTVIASAGTLLRATSVLIESGVLAEIDEEVGIASRIGFVPGQQTEQGEGDEAIGLQLGAVQAQCSQDIVTVRGL